MQKIKSNAKCVFAASLLYVYLAIAKFLARFHSFKTPGKIKPTIVITGKFASLRWAAAHLLPLAESNLFSQIWVVATRQDIDCDAITWIEPPALLTKVLGNAPARLMTFLAIAVRRRPDWIAGFHLLFNGLFAIMLALILRRRSLYYCVGGPAEVADGGLQSENKIFGAIGRKSKKLERMLINATHFSHAIVFMGNSAQQYYEDKGYTGVSMVNPGGISMPIPSPALFSTRNIDVIFVGRLSRIKDIPLFLRTIAVVKESRPDVTVVIVGDGAERAALEKMTNDLGLTGNISFTGYQDDVQNWLNNAKVLMLTSISEGLSLAIMEAVTLGIPVVAPNVGDLGEAVLTGRTGYLVDTRSADDFAARILEIVTSEANFNRLREAALQWSSNFSIEASAKQWASFEEHYKRRESAKCAG